jgi:hypothetical protein
MVITSYHISIPPFIVFVIDLETCDNVVDSILCAVGEKELMDTPVEAILESTCNPPQQALRQKNLKR